MSDVGADPMRVGMNLLWLRPGVVGGSEVAAVSTVQALTRHAATDVDLHLYTQPSFVDAYPTVAAHTPTRTAKVPLSSRVARVVSESTWLPRAVAADRIEVVHAYGGVVPPRLGKPAVLTLHDTQPLEPGAAFGAVKKRWLRRMIPASVARAAMVAVPSEFVRRRVLDLIDVAPHKIVVVPHALDTTMDLDPVTVGEATVIRDRFALEGPTVVYPAITYPHKNHEVLLRAFARLVTDRDATLVLIGGAGSAEDDVVTLAHELGITDSVRRLGRVSRVDRDMLVRDAAAVAMPSRYEGFGLPVLEALAADTPVVASTSGSLPEVLGDAGTLVDPDDVEGWAAALADAIDRGDDPAGTARRAAQVATMSWERSSARLVELYRQAASGAPPTGHGATSTSSGGRR